MPEIQTYQVGAAQHGGASRAAAFRRPLHTFAGPARWAIGQWAGLVGLVAAALLWELLARSGVLPEEVPPVTSMLASLGHEVATGSFWSELGQTIVVTLVGMAIATVIGVVLGIAIGASTLTYQLTQGVVEFLRPIPPLVYLPFVLLVVGANTEAGIVLVVTAAVWPVLVQTAYGVHDVDPVMRDVATAYGLSLPERIRCVIVPTTLPFVASAIRIAVMMALIVTIGIELLGTGGGLGGAVYFAEQQGQYADMYSYALVAGILGVLFSAALMAGERRVLAWHPIYREDAR